MPVMKIALVNFVRRGGMVHYHSQLAAALASQQQTMAIIAHSTDRQFYQDSTLAITTVETGHSAKQMLLRLFNPATWLTMRRMIRGLQVDLIHVTSPYPWNIFLCFWARQPLAYTVHDPQPHPGEKWLIKISEKMMRRRAKLLFVHSQSGKEQLMQQGYTDQQIVIVPHGRYDLFATKSRPKLAGQASDQILFFGRIEAYKGLDTLLQAMPFVWQSYPNWQLVIAGHGDLQPYKQWLGDSRVRVNNEFIPDEQVADYFSQASLVVLPYKSATNSGVIPIASAFAKPSIATKVGGLPQVIEHGQTGLLVDPEKPEQLAQAIIQLISHPQQAQAMGQAAKQKAEQDFDWQPIAKTHVEAYRQALQRLATP